MLNLLYKEIKLSASKLSFLFILFSLLFFVPGYPILMAVFFVTLGIFQSFQNARETNDIVFSALLPIAKKDVVKGKYLFVVVIELVSFLLMLIVATIRNTVFVDAPIYRNNALMNVNLFTLSFALIIFGLFNIVFVNGFFKTAYKFAKRFVAYIIISFLVIGIAETLYHIPGLEMLNTFGFENIQTQILLLGIGIILFICLTLMAYKKSCLRFEKIDL